MKNAIEVTNITKSFHDFTLDNISFSLPQGTIMGLIGENGAGKSTIINLIMNSLRPDKGHISVLDTDNQSLAFRNLKNRIGVVLDEAYFPEIMTPSNVNSIMKYTYTNWQEDTFIHYLDKFRLPSDKKFKDFSRGMKMKLAIAVALSHKAELLILDEATSGLDPMVRDEILDIFNDFTRDPSHTILISSHIVSDLEKICDYITFIHNGKKIFCKEKDLILENYALVKVSHTDFESIPAEAVISKKNNRFDVEALVEKKKISTYFTPERTSLEDIILFMAKEDI